MFFTISIQHDEDEFPKLMLRDTVFVILRNCNLIYLSVDKIIIHICHKVLENAKRFLKIDIYNFST